MIENLFSKIDSLSGQTPRIENLEVDHVDTGNQASTSRSTVMNELSALEGHYSSYISISEEPFAR